MNEQLNKHAKLLYATYAAAVGGTAFNGDPLPEWDDFKKDPDKHKQSQAWLAVADISMRTKTGPVGAARRAIARPDLGLVDRPERVTSEKELHGVEPGNELRANRTVDGPDFTDTDDHNQDAEEADQEDGNNREADGNYEDDGK